MPQQESRQRLGIRRDIERLVGGNARILAGRDIAHRIAARFPRRHAGRSQQAHRRLDLVQLDEMKLDVLPRGDVAEPARVLLGDVRERAELRRGQHPLRDLHANHLRIVDLALSVGAANEAEDAPLLRCDLAALELAEHLGELVDVGIARKRQPRAAKRFRVWT